jgi:hypothetical protein
MWAKVRGNIKTRFLSSVVALILGANLVSCTKYSSQTEDPKRRLTEYISRSFSVKSPEDKTQLLNYLTGEVKDRLSSWSDDQFREAFLDSKREFLKLSFREVKSISDHETQITYELSYMDSGKPKEGQRHPSKVTNKKLCRLVLEQNKWFITEVKNIKELVEYQNELSLP